MNDLNKNYSKYDIMTIVFLDFLHSRELLNNNAFEGKKHERYNTHLYNFTKDYILDLNVYHDSYNIDTYNILECNILHYIMTKIKKCNQFNRFMRDLSEGYK